MMKTMRCRKCKELGEHAPEKTENCDTCLIDHRRYATAMGKPDPLLTVNISVIHEAYGSVPVKLPIYKNWDDVQNVSIKYDQLFIEFKDGEELILDMETELSIEIFKWPSFTVRDENNEQLYSN